jgi:hypothetical protein
MKQKSLQRKAKIRGNKITAEEFHTICSIHLSSLHSKFNSSEYKACNKHYIKFGTDSKAWTNGPLDQAAPQV